MFRAAAAFLCCMAFHDATTLHALQPRDGDHEPETLLVELVAEGPPSTAEGAVSVETLPAPWRALFAGAGASVIEPLFPAGSGLSRWYRVRLSHGTVEESCRLLASSSLVGAAEPNYFRFPDGLGAGEPAEPGRRSGAETWPNDPLFSPEEWGLENSGQFGGIPGFDLNALHGWQSYGASQGSARVAILDSGVDPDHPDLPFVELGINAVGSGPPIDDDTATWQGTACAGIVAMTGNNGVGGAGVGWSLTPVACKIRSGALPPTAADIAQAVDWCRANDVAVVCLGYSSSTPSMLEKQALRNAHAAGLVTVVSSGNDNTGSARYPAAYARHVVTVGAFFTTGDRWVDARLCGLEGSPLGSCFGAWLDLTAPGGRGIATTRHHGTGGGYYDLDIDAGASCLAGTLDWSDVDGFGGTAAAAAFVSGAVGVVLATNPALCPEDAQEIVVRTAVDHQLPVRGWDSEYGWGRPDLEEALRLASPPYVAWHMTTYVGSPYYDGSGLALFIDADTLPDGQYGFLRYRVEATIPVGETFIATPMGWGRVEGTIGWPRIEDGSTFVATDEDAGSCKVVGLSTTSVTVRTYVYDLFRVDGSRVGTFPHDGITAMSFTVLGPGELLGVAEEPGPPEASLRVAPNPTTDGVEIALPAGGQPADAAVHVYDAAGRHVARIPLDASGAARWELRDRSGARVTPGVYFAKLPGGSRQPAARIVVTR